MFGKFHNLVNAHVLLALGEAGDVKSLHLKIVKLFQDINLPKNKTLTIITRNETEEETKGKILKHAEN
jgi:uncharacterized alpha/beta hydrolase family protein